MAAVTWTAYNTADDVGGTAFNSLADAAGAISSEIDNSTGLYRWGDLEITQGGAVTSVGLGARSQRADRLRLAEHALSARPEVSLADAAEESFVSIRRTSMLRQMSGASCERHRTAWTHQPSRWLRWRPPINLPPIAAPNGP